MSVFLWALATVAVALAFANGANDNFKGVATLYGSGTTTYRRALVWATLTTAAGSLTALLVASSLVARFTGKGLVPDALTGEPAFLTAVGGGAAVTVLLASRLGLPISTTHALTGALVGAGVAAAPDALAWSALGSSFLAPLLLSPALAALLMWGTYVLFRRVAQRAMAANTCVCVADAQALEAAGTASLSQHAMANPVAVVADRAVCERDGLSQVVTVRRAVDAAHYLSAGAVGFARGVNDTPKLLALLVPVHVASPQSGALVVAAAMALGGVLGARRVAETISHRVTAMNAEQGFCANVATAVLVLLASRFGLPVSTTHVSSGALFGLGAMTGQARWATVAQIALAWVVTLPCAALAAILLWHAFA
jgi:inorganic phosphate transporter, PiT family